MSKLDDDWLGLMRIVFSAEMTLALPRLSPKVARAVWKLLVALLGTLAVTKIAI